LGRFAHLDGEVVDGGGGGGSNHAEQCEPAGYRAQIQRRRDRGGGAEDARTRCGQREGASEASVTAVAQGRRGGWRGGDGDSGARREAEAQAREQWGGAGRHRRSGRDYPGAPVPVTVGLMIE